VLALLLRIVFISQLPNGFTPDEASFAYDAYSILHTGKDQWGHRFPLVLESFGDFKAPLYSYILIPFVAIGGLSVSVTRLPNAILGSFAVIVVYFMVRELVEYGLLDIIKLRNKIPSSTKNRFSLVVSILLAISPWHIMMSRGAFEANLTTFFIPLALYLWLKSMTSKDVSTRNKWFVISNGVFGLNLFTYHSAKLVTPLIFFGLIFLTREKLRVLSRNVRIAGLSLFVLFVCLMSYSFQIGAGTRAADVSVLSGAMEAASAPRLAAIQAGTNPLLAKVIHNQYSTAGVRFAKNYIQYFSPKFLIFDGPAEATYGMIPGVGVLYTLDIIFLISFIFFLARSYKQWRTKENRVLWFVIAWTLLAPIPAALATGAGYAGNRSVIMLPELLILVALGGFYLHEQISHILKQTYFKRVITSVVIIYVISVISLLGKYFVSQKYQGAEAMLWGRESMITYLSQNDISPYSTKTVIDKRLSEPQIYVAFFMEIDPVDYQKWSQNWEVYREADVKFVDQLDEYEMGKFLFTTNFEEKGDRFNNEYVLVGKPEEFSSTTTPDFVVRNPDGSDSIYVVTPEKDTYAYYEM